MKTKKKVVINNDEDANLGLDADHSSEMPSLAITQNDDNDRISGNPNGENDNGEEHTIIDSPLDDK